MTAHSCIVVEREDTITTCSGVFDHFCVHVLLLIGVDTASRCRSVPFVLAVQRVLPRSPPQSRPCGSLANQRQTSLSRFSTEKVRTCISSTDRLDLPIQF